MVEAFHGIEGDGYAVIAETIGYAATARDAREAAGLSWPDLAGAAAEKPAPPRLPSKPRQAAATGSMIPGAEAEIEAFAGLIAADRMDEARAVTQRLLAQPGGRDQLIHCLLAPAARRLGAMWDQDLCDFTTVTLGVARLDQLVKETASAGGGAPGGRHYRHAILLLPAPGEQHGFGLNIIADAFCEQGWSVSSGPALPALEIRNLVRNEWFDVLGLSVTSDRALVGLAACIRSVRQASCNRRLFVMAGGRAVTGNPHAARFLDADLIAVDMRQALAAAEYFVGNAMADSLAPFTIGLVDLRLVLNA